MPKIYANIVDDKSEKNSISLTDSHNSKAYYAPKPQPSLYIYNVGILCFQNKIYYLVNLLH